MAVTDALLDGLSAVYTFFDPNCGDRSLGVYTILWQIEEVKRQHRELLYLGYLINQSPKMAYKREYQPQEHFVGRQWIEAGA